MDIKGRPHIVNDSSGLCLTARGLDPKSAGVYTNITRLAAKLPGDSPSLVTIEFEKAAILVKEYDGHAVAVKVPVRSTKS